MSLKEFLALEVGEFVIFVGLKENFGKLIPGEIFEVLDTGKNGFRIATQTGVKFVVWVSARETSLHISDFVILPNTTSDETHLIPNDYEQILDFALDTKDYVWAENLHAKAHGKL